MKNLLLTCILLFPIALHAGYEVKGRINVSDSWQNQIFLATIDKLDHYYKADPSNIINVASIDSEGRFTLQGDNLPLEKRFYRLYLIKEANSEFDACLYVGGDDHNYVHIILDNETQLDLMSDEAETAPFANYTIKGNEENQLMRNLNQLIHPSHYFYEIKFPSELQFSQDKLNRDLVAFADTCSIPLVGLAALVNVDMDNYYEIHEGTYERYGDELKAKYKDHPYTQDFFRKLNYYKEPEPTTNTSWWPWLISVGLGVMSSLLWMRNRSLRAQLDQVQQLEVPSAPERIQLTNQEQKILNLIVDGKSNKEIASALYIEVSTVKTHINKLYAKLGVKDRTAAIKKGKSLVFTGV